MKKLRWLAGLALLAVGGCSPLYGPYHGDTGYADVMVQDDTYDVSFVGYDGLNETQAKKYALMRAAELTLMHGRQWFELVDSSSRTRVLTSEVPATVIENGRRRNYSETVTGGYTVQHDRPEAFIRVHLLPGQKENALNAAAIIRDAETVDKVKFKDLPAQAATQQK